VLLFFMLPILLIPYADKGHSVMLFWLRPRYVPSLLVHLTSANTQQSSNSSSNLLAQADQASQASCHPLRYPVLRPPSCLLVLDRWPNRRRQVHQAGRRPAFVNLAAYWIQQQRHHKHPYRIMCQRHEMSIMERWGCHRWR